ncbi:MAG: hypothetical protein WAL32_14675 [Terriglobales bacterium]
MKWANKIRTLTVLALFSILPCTAQETVEDLHARGVVGFDFSSNTFAPVSNASSGPSPTTPSTFFGGEIGMDVSGIVKDPRFITFDSNFDFQRGASSVSELGYSSDLLSGGVSAHLLPASKYPFDVFYQHTGADTSGSIFGSNTTITQFRAQWTINSPNLPHLVLGYSDNSNTVNWADSFSNAGYKQSDWSATANDHTLGWYWNAGFDLGKLDETSLGTLNFGSGGAKEDYRTFDARAYRRFWNDKAIFDTDVRDQHYSYDFPGTGTSSSDNLLLSSSLQIQHTRKLSSHYTYYLSHLNEQNTFATNADEVTLLSIPTLDTQGVDAGVSYQVAQPLRIFQDVEYDHLTPLSATAESETSLFQSSSGVAVTKRWRGLDLSGTYTGIAQSMATNFSNKENTWSNNVDSRVGWGNVQKVHLTGTYRYEHLNLVQEIGGFSQFNTYGAQAETTRFWGVRLSGGMDHGKVDLLNISGETKRIYNNYFAQLEHRRFHLSASRGLNDGSGLIFPTTLINQSSFFVPLPIAQLISTPLLNLTSRTTSINLLGRVKRNLEIDADFRKESDLLISSTQNYRLWEVRAQYRIGKVSIDAGLGNLHSAINQSDSLSGLGINRYWFRIRRSFNLF